MFKWTKNKATDLKNYTGEIFNAKGIKSTTDEIIDMAKQTLDPRAIKIERTESFEHAKQRLNLKMSDLNQLYYNYALSFYIAATAGLLCFVYLLYALFLERKFMASLSSLGIMLFCLANCFQFSFRTFQIKHQKLCSVKDWWNRGGDWIPTITREIIKPSSSRDIVKK